MAENCRTCGAPDLGLICRYCGAQNGAISSPTDELVAVDELKLAIARIGQQPTSAAGALLSVYGLDSKTNTLKGLIDTMWIPSSPEAALRLGSVLLGYVTPRVWGTTPFQQQVTLSALARLDAIVAQLQLEHPMHAATGRLAQAVAERRYQLSEARKNLWFGLGAALVFFFVVVPLLISLL